MTSARPWKPLTGSSRSCPAPSPAPIHTYPRRGANPISKPAYEQEPGQPPVERKEARMREHFRDYNSDDASLSEEERLRREARHRAHQRMGFLRHLAIFIPVILLVFAIDVLTDDGWWIQWVAGIWGGILAIHFLYAF